MAIRQKAPSHPPRVALFVETTLGSGRDILRGIARYVRERGPWALFHWPGGFETLTPATLRQWKGDGVIARLATPEDVRLVRHLKAPVVDVLGLVPRTGFPLVHVDDAAIARMVVRHFAERGFRRFAFVGLAGEIWSERRLAAFVEEVRALGGEAEALELHRAEAWELRRRRLAKWLERLPKPVGLMVCSDQCGVDVLEACGGIEVPNEIALVGVDNDEPLCEICNPPLSSVSPDHEAVGYAAAALLDRLMQGGGAGAPAEFIPPQRVITRQSSDVLAVDDPAVARALRVIQERACEGVPVDEIARESGVSRSVLQRRFRHALGETIHDRLLATRLKRAVELIATTSLPLAEVAERCGFVHQEYMGVVFRKELGRTPSTYRRRLGEG